MAWHLDVVEATIQAIADPVVAVLPAVLHEAQVLKCQHGAL